MTEGLDGFPEVRSNGHRLVWTAVPPSGKSPGGVVVGRVSVEQEPSLPSWWPRRDRSPGTRAEGWGCSGRDRLPLWTELSAEIRQTSRNAVSWVGVWEAPLTLVLGSRSQGGVVRCWRRSNKA